MQEQQWDTSLDIRKHVVFNAPIDKVWQAVSTAQGIAAWLMPNDFQPILGFAFTFNAGEYGISHCKVTELDPPHSLGFEWGKDWHIRFELKDVDGKTDFTLIHSGWDAEKATEFGESHTVVRERMDQGWGDLTRLRNFVEA